MPARAPSDCVARCVQCGNERNTYTVGRLEESSYSRVVSRFSQSLSKIVNHNPRAAKCVLSVMRSVRDRDHVILPTPADPRDRFGSPDSAASGRSRARVYGDGVWMTHNS